MKKRNLWLMIIGAILIVVGAVYCLWNRNFQFSNEEVQNTSFQTGTSLETQQEKQVPFSGMSLEDLAALGIEAPKAVDQYLADNLPECQFPKLKDEPITVIDDVVKNCQTKEKKGQIPDGLGGACADSFAYDVVGERVTSINGRDCYYGIKTQEYLSRGVKMNFLCKFSPTLERDSDEFAVELQDGDITSANPDRFTAGQNLFALEKALGGGLLSQVSPDWFNIPSLYCANNDPDCMGVYSAGSWSDAQGNYFVAGTRSDMSKKEIKTEDNTYYLPTTLYAINDKLYLPGMGTGSSSDLIRGKKRTTERLFGGIKDGKIIMKRLKDIVSTGKLLPEGHTASTYTLETCEIDL